MLVGLLVMSGDGHATFALSAGLKPLPDIETTVPGSPELGVSVILGVVAVTVKVVVATSIAVLAALSAVTITVYVPGTALVLTVNGLPTNVPVPEESPLHVGGELKMLTGLLITLPGAVQEVSVKKNPLPDKVPDVPGGPVFGVNVTVGPVTVKGAVPKSSAGLPLLPRTSTV